MTSKQTPALRANAEAGSIPTFNEIQNIPSAANRKADATTGSPAGRVPRPFPRRAVN